MYARFAWGLNGFLRKTIGIEQSRQIILQKLQNRNSNFLLSLKKTVYENPGSPYLKLLRLAGCDYGDLEKIVSQDGVESGLKKIAREGVFISAEEFKGKQEARRGSSIFRFSETDFDNPYLRGQLETSTSARRSKGTRTIYDLDYGAEISTVYYNLMYDAHGIIDAPFALWWPILPGSGPVVSMAHAKAGILPLKWFSPLDKQSFRPSLKNKAGTDLILFISRLAGVRLPRPEYISMDDAVRIAHWAANMIDRRGICVVNCYASLAVRVCQSAKKANLDLSGARFVISGEPVTEAKRREIESAGGLVCPVYGFTEGGILALGCVNPKAADDYHLCKDTFALIQQSKQVSFAATSLDSFLFSTLSPYAPKVLLNVESGDWGRVETRRCGCKLEELGFTDHLYNVRGFDKINGEGMTFAGADMLTIVEEILPAKFGGASCDYQMLEEEDEQGHTRMSILVSPSLGEIDEDEIIETVLARLSDGNDTRRMMVEMWAQAKTLQVKRIPPYTLSGKLVPLHIKRPEHQHC